MRRQALIDGDFRYWLERDWAESEGSPYVLWVMLNPSTADHRADDPTVRKCIGFTKRFGYSRLFVVNLFALRATDPAVLQTVQGSGGDVVGPCNDEYISKLAQNAPVIVCAWGAYDGLGFRIEHRIREVRSILERWRRCTTCKGTMSLPVEGGGVSCPTCLDHQGEERCPTVALGYAKAGQPRHPLMMPYYAAAELKPWPSRPA